MREISTPEGSLILTEAALAAVAGAAALRCPGVVAIPPSRLQDELARLLLDPHPPRDPREARTAEVQLDADHCRVGLDIVVAFGARISDVCRDVAVAVSADMLQAAGFRPDHVDVRVVGVRSVRGAPADRRGAPANPPGPAAPGAPLPAPARSRPSRGER